MPIASMVLIFLIISGDKNNPVGIYNRIEYDEKLSLSASHKLPKNDNIGVSLKKHKKKKKKKLKMVALIYFIVSEIKF